MIKDFWIILIILGCGMSVSIKAGKLNVAGATVGGVIGFLVFAGAGYVGVAMIATFFILGSAATSWKINYKEQSGLAEKNKGKRTAAQVFANGGIAGILGFLSWLHPEKASLFNMMMAASLASATADTLSSELGNVYGRNFYNIASFRKDARGLNGVVSLEGSIFGIIGSVIIAAIFGSGFGWDVKLLWIILAGTIGNISDSILGATLERQEYLNNNSVNFLNTFISALTALLFYTTTI